MTRDRQVVICAGCSRQLPPDCLVTVTRDGEILGACGPACAERAKVKNTVWSPVERDRFFGRTRS